jgi:hypothetical protein
MDWGYSPDPGHVTWFAHLPSGRFIAFKEWSFRETLARDVADGIHERSAGMKIRTSIAGHDLWMKSKETGEELAETFARRRLSFQCANTDRVHGWQRLHSLLRETVDEGHGPVPRLQVYIGGDHGPGCAVLARTLPMLRQDPKRPGDVLEQDDHAPDTARWFAMDRPAAGRAPDKPSAWSRLSAEARRRILAAGRGSSTLGSESVRRR